MRTATLLSLAAIPPPGFAPAPGNPRQLRGQLFVLHAPDLAQTLAFMDGLGPRLCGLLTAPNATWERIAPTVWTLPWRDGLAVQGLDLHLGMLEELHAQRNQAEHAHQVSAHIRNRYEALQTQIEDQRRQREAQRRQNRQLEIQRALFVAQQEVAIDGIVIFAQDGRVLYHNQRYLDLFAIPPEFTNHRDRLLPHVASLMLDTHLTQRYFRDEAGHDLRERAEIPLKDGRILDRFTAPLKSPDGGELGRVWFYRDITVERHREAALHAAKEAAESAGQAKATFLATMSHELRTPLTGILVTADLLRDLDLCDDQRQLLDGLVRSGQHLHHLLSETLDLSSLEAGALRLRLQDADPTVVMKEVAEIARPLAQAKRLTFHLEFADGMPTCLYIDPARLRQVLLNLVSNAIKFTQAGRVTLWAWGSPEGFVCAVADTGPGIPAEDLDRLFQPFTQLSAGPSRLHEGTGLGLAIVRELVLLMGGTVGVESRVGHGSTFTIRIPVRPAGG